jgi:hypothetical protein
VPAPPALAAGRAAAGSGGVSAGSGGWGQANRVRARRWAAASVETPSASAIA